MVAPTRASVRREVPSAWVKERSSLTSSMGSRSMVASDE
jgi:hypothetical protein